MKIEHQRLSLSFLFFLNLMSLASNAQNLPNKQETSVRAPGNIKIDGYASEFQNKFEAYNKATDMYYTLSNDDKNIYLAIRADYQDVADKILRGGLTLTINHTQSKKDDNPLLITYPNFPGSAQSDVTNMFARKVNQKKYGTESDFSIDDLNKMMDTQSKSIKVSGIKDIPDDNISVYNSNGIKAVSKFNNQLQYTFELALPIKCLMLPSGVNSFTYNIKINEPYQVTRLSTMGGPPSPPMPHTSIAATDFWGELNLLKNKSI